MKLILPVDSLIQLYSTNGQYIWYVMSTRLCSFDLSELDAWKELYDAGYRNDSYSELEADRKWAYCHRFSTPVKYILKNEEWLVEFIVFDKKCIVDTDALVDILKGNV